MSVAFRSSSDLLHVCMAELRFMLLFKCGFSLESRAGGLPGAVATIACLQELSDVVQRWARLGEQPSVDSVPHLEEVPCAIDNVPKRVATSFSSSGRCQGSCTCAQRGSLVMVCVATN